MSDEKKRFAAVRDNEKLYSYALGSKEQIEKVVARWSSKDGEEDKIRQDNLNSSQDFSHHSALTETLNSSVEFALSQYQIIILLGTLEFGISQGYVKSKIFEPLEEEGTLVDQKGDYKVYEITDELYEKIDSNDEKAQIMKKGASKITPSVFLGMIATFDALIVDIVGKLIKLNPERYATPDKTIPLDRIIGATSVEDIVQSFISEELYRFSRESHESQTSYIEKNFSISIKEKWKRWTDFIEIFERRNLVAHGESKFNQRYAQICDKNGHKGSFDVVGQEIKVEINYLIQSLDVLCEYAILLSFSLWRKMVTEKEAEAFETLNEAAYKLISNGRFTLPQRILEFALSLNGTNVSEEIRKMMVVNRASASKSSQGSDVCNKILNDEDWSACSFEFKISVAALKEEVKTVCSLVSSAKQSGFDVSNFRLWPVFRFLRDNEELNDEIEKHYGCRISKSEKSVAKEDEPPVIEHIEVDDDTVH